VNSSPNPRPGFTCRTTASARSDLLRRENAPWSSRPRLATPESGQTDRPSLDPELAKYLTSDRAPVHIDVPRRLDTRDEPSRMENWLLHDGVPQLPGRKSVIHFSKRFAHVCVKSAPQSRIKA
jgi:hypothetical protein